MIKNNKIKILFISLLLFLSFFLYAQSNIPNPEGYVTDYAGVISNSDKEIIETLGAEIKQKSGTEIAVLTVKTFEPYSSIEEFANEVFEKWGIGEKGKDNGILIVLSTGERRVRIEVGYGLEGTITDGRAGSIIDQYMIPYLKNNNFSEGLKAGYAAVSAVIASEYNFEITGIDAQQYNKKEEGVDLSELIGILGFLVVFFMTGGRIFWALFFMSPSAKRNYRNRFGSGFGGGGGFSGGFGGGFGGFGGGSSGGGGASRGF